MRFRAILVVRSEDMNTLIKKMKALGNVQIIDVFDTEKNNWLNPSNDFKKLLNEHLMRVQNA